MSRIAAVVGLPAEGREEYERLHEAVWPGVLDRLARSHITNYSIYRHKELLFSYMEYVGEDLRADLAAIAADPLTQQWWALCAPLQLPVDDDPDQEQWTTLPEIFHFGVEG